MKITTINLNLSQEREQAYLSVLRKRFNKPRAGWSRLVLALIREACAEEEEEDPQLEKYPRLPHQLFVKE